MAKDSPRGSSTDDERELDNVADDDLTDDDLLDSDEDDVDLEDDDLDDEDVDDDLEDDVDDDDVDEKKRGATAVTAKTRPKKAARKPERASSAGAKKGRSTAKQSAARKERQSGAVAGAAAGSFVQQVVSELRKVVWPTGKQMVTYTTVVLVFVVLLVAAVWAFDLGVGKLMDWIFA